MRSGVQVLAAKISLAVSSQSAHLDFKLLYWMFFCMVEGKGAMEIVATAFCKMPCESESNRPSSLLRM